MQKYVIVMHREFRKEQQIIESTGLVLKDNFNFSYFQTSMNWPLGQAVNIRDELIKKGCDSSKIRVEYDYT